MKGSKEVIDLLNEVLAGELVAINQYFLHAKMCKNWGYFALADYIKKESIDEMRHAETLVDRILFLEGLPNLQRLDKLHVGQTVPEQLKSDLEVEYRAVKRLNATRAALAVLERTTPIALSSVEKAMRGTFKRATELRNVANGSQKALDEVLAAVAEHRGA